MVYYRDYAEAAMQDLFDKAVLERSLVYQLNSTETTLFLGKNQGFEKSTIPNALQYSPVYATHIVNGANAGQLYVGGNQYLVKPQFGRYDASKGWAVPFSIQKGELQWGTPESMNIKGQIRAIQPLKTNSKTNLIFAINDAYLQYYEMEN